MQPRTHKPRMSPGNRRARARSAAPEPSASLRGSEPRQIADHHAESAQREFSPPRDDRAG